MTLKQNSNNKMKDQNWEKWVLDAIRKIRQQKQRPSVERICRAIRQHQDHTEAAIQEHLEALVQKGVVLKILNKGQISYKDPSASKGFTPTAPTPKSEKVKEPKKEPKEKDVEVSKSPSKVKREKKRSAVLAEETPKAMNVDEFLEVTSDFTKPECSSTDDTLVLLNCRASDPDPSSSGNTRKRPKLRHDLPPLDSFASYVSTTLGGLPQQNCLAAIRDIVAILHYQKEEAEGSSALRNSYHFIVSPP